MTLVLLSIEEVDDVEIIFHFTMMTSPAAS